MFKADGIVDYIVLIVADVGVDVNPNEVRDTCYVSPDELREMFKHPRSSFYVWTLLIVDLEFTPWFRLICQKFLYEWWENLDDLEKFRDQREVIHRMV